MATRRFTPKRALEKSRPQQVVALDLSEREAANSVAVVNALLDPTSSIVEPGLPLQETTIEDELAVISEELDSRWRGALFALNPSNPEASRHFCSSSREIIAAILETKAPDELVFRVLPGCSTTTRLALGGPGSLEAPGAPGARRRSPG